jgi:hypothetical protein
MGIIAWLLVLIYTTRAVYRDEAERSGPALP